MRTAAKKAVCRLWQSIIIDKIDEQEQAPGEAEETAGVEIDEEAQE